MYASVLEPDRSARLIETGAKILLLSPVKTFFCRKMYLLCRTRKLVFYCWTIFETRAHFLFPSLNFQVLIASSTAAIESKILAQASLSLRSEITRVVALRYNRVSNLNSGSLECETLDCTKTLRLGLFLFRLY